jgi:stage V sporulation protein D (sporulation-specific penicillin-binding protein)
MKRRANIAVLTGIFAFAAVITVNLFKLMVVDAKIYQDKADESQFGTKTLPAARGSIYTSDGKILAQSATAYQIMIDPNTFRNNDLDNSSIIAYYIHTKLGVKKSDAAEAVRKNKIMDFLDALPETYNLSEVRSKFNGRTVKEINKVLFSEFLAGALKIDAAVVRDAMEQDSRCIYLAQKAEKPVKDKIQDYIVENGISCMDLTPNPKRYYPQDDLASSVVGFLDYEGNGQYGIERQYDEYLSGVDGVIITAQDAHDEQMPYRYSKLYEAKDGNSVNLTVDSMIQYYCETSLDKYIESSQAAEYGCAIVMNAKTGAVLGMYSAPGFDINNKGVLSEADQALLDSDSTMITATELPVIGEKGEIEKITEADLLERVWKNKAISVINEPGSVFKVFTSAAAFEEKIASFEDKYVCNGFEMINNSRINCHKEYGHGEQDFKKALLNSCNPAFMQIGLKLGGEKFSYYADAFGLREPTGIDLPGEADSAFLSGSVLKNNDFDLAESAFGQANCLTPIQIITGYTAAINGGYLLRPHIVGSIVDSDMNEVIRVEPEIRRQVISEHTSALVREALQNNVDAAETGNAKINGYKIGGKSGTAEKESKKASEGYKYDRLLEKSAEAVKIYPAPSLQHVASYCAFAPADDPEIVVYVAVDEPQQGSVYGGVIAAPCVREIMEKTLPYLGYYPEYTDEEVLTMDKRVPDVDELSAEEAVNQIKEAGFTPVLRGEGDNVISQSPSFTSSMPAGCKVFLYTDHVAEPKVIMMPDLSNMKIAEVRELFETLGLNLKANGSQSDEAIVLSQSVEAKSSVTEGAIVQVLFGVNSQTG